MMRVITCLPLGKENFVKNNDEEVNSVISDYRTVTKQVGLLEAVLASVQFMASLFVVTWMGAAIFGIIQRELIDGTGSGFLVALVSVLLVWFIRTRLNALRYKMGDMEKKMKSDQ